MKRLSRRPQSPVVLDRNKKNGPSTGKPSPKSKQKKKATPKKPIHEDGEENLEVNDKVWVPHADRLWQTAEVLSVSRDTITVMLGDIDVSGTMKSDPGKDFLTYPTSKVLSYDDDHVKDWDDIFQMGDLNEPGMLNVLRERFSQEKIYTFTGDVLLSINPYKEISGLYNMSRGKGEPHVFALAKQAYDKMLTSSYKNISQSILINGESGAGKTEAAKYIMRYLANLSQRKRQEVRSRQMKNKGFGGVRGKAGMSKFFNKIGKGNSTRGFGAAAKPANDTEFSELTMSQVERVLLLSNPLLEAFGNSQTIRNKNSSRFGKFVQLEYDSDGVIEGGRTKYFLLEKSRIVRHAVGERNYHIFYQICAAGVRDPEIRDLLNLLPALSYTYLQPTVLDAEDEASSKRRFRRRKKKVNIKTQTPSKTPDQTLDEDYASFMNTQEAMEAVNIGEEEQEEIWKALSAVLALGNIKFAKSEEDEDESQVDANGDAYLAIQVAAKLLGVPVEELSEALTHRSVRAGNKSSFAMIGLSITQAMESADGLAKALYQAVFDLLITRINVATKIATTSQFSSGLRKQRAPLFIGILDIFGFEVLETNSFEQLCINFANEVLQRMFDQHVFDLEMSCYAQEGIHHDIKLRDSQKLIQLIDHKGSGILQLLDEQGMLGKRGNDAGFLSKIDQKHLNRNNFYIRSRLIQEDGFIIKHYAGQVTYSVKGMVEKNTDALQPDLEALIFTSENEFLKDALKRSRTSGKAKEDNLQGRRPRRGTLDSLVGKIREVGGRKMAKMESVSMRFRNQMYELEKMLNSTGLHFVRCIKPSEKQTPFAWDYVKVFNQLNMLGSLEMIRIRREGFPIQSVFESIADRYWELVKDKNPKIIWRKGENDKAVCEYILLDIFGPGLRNKGWQLGNTKCFLREKVLNALDYKVRRKREEGASAMEMLKKKRKARALAKKRNNAASKIAAVYRGSKVRRKVRMEKQSNDASKKITAVLRGNLERKQLQRQKHAAISIQRVVRGNAQQKEFKKKQHAILRIQTNYRGFTARKVFAKLPYITRMQAIVRGRKVRLRYNEVRKQSDPLSEILEPGEVVVHSSMVWKYTIQASTNIMIRKRRLLVFTTGRIRRIIYAKVSVSGKKIYKGELNWNPHVTSVLLKSSRDFIITTEPSGPRSKTSFTFRDFTNNALKWCFVLQYPVSMVDLMQSNALFSEVITMKGTMKKRGIRSHKRWKDRSFVLQGSTMYWSHTDDGPVTGGFTLNKETKITLPGKHVTLKPFCMDIHTPLMNDTFRIQAQNKDQLKAWFYAMTLAIETHKRMTSTYKSDRKIIPMVEDEDDAEAEIVSAGEVISDGETSEGNV